MGSDEYRHGGGEWLDCVDVGFDEREDSRNCTDLKTVDQEVGAAYI